ncbi:ABC transporter ATP-binding protein [Pseudactinotalea sp. HY158]|uniref:ABC transporter ATP-binding protein n=1 Tax=Pseudactinotalea sp. HY158 TaxID=2654547 RepID=UPI00129C581E|nr:ABC transporter ATP-binding protein [Pseudactinotalea sp. HY158]QGH70678.1 ATP-binding cassette domain-containing protein [Pseudactinotalea sp. HY158]
MSALARILRFTRSLTPYYIGIMIVAAITTGAALAVPFLTGHATDVIVATIDGDGEVGAAVRTVVLIAAAVLAAELLNSVVSNIGGYWGDVMSARMRTILSVRYYDKLLQLPQRYFDNELTGTIVARLNRSINEIANFAKTVSNMFATLTLTTIAVLAVSAWHYWPLAVLLFIAYPVYLWLTALTSRRWQRLEGRKNTHVDLASGRFNEVVGQIRVVKSFTRERSELAGFTDHFDATVDLTREQSVYWHRMDALRRGVLNLIFFALYALIFVRTVRGHLSVGQMVMLVQLMAMAREPVTSLSWVVDSAQRAIAGSKSYFEVMELDPAVLAAALPASVGTTQPASGAPLAEPVLVEEGEARTSGGSGGSGASMISFDDVRFGYDTDPNVIDGISFEVAPGEKIALVGESGGGKTTIVNLLLGLYRMRSGRIEVAGLDVATADLDEVRRSIGVVFQDASLFSGTIRENIVYGAPGAGDEEVAEVAGRAAVDEFVRKFPDGFDTVIGERGMKLSGGQKQRIAVARAMLKDAPVLVLDEATSALDTKSERLVQAGLDDLMAERTSLIIAHRLSTIAGVDRIITLRDGRIDELGPPAELAASGGIYAELLSLQNSTAKADRRRLRTYDVVG